MAYVYILTNQSNTTLSIGVTSNLEKRIIEHKRKLMAGYFSKYNLTKLIYYECTERIEDAIAREKQLKGWIRRKKVDLISKLNPQWKDLCDDFESNSSVI